MLKLSTNATVALIFLSAVGSIIYMVTSDSPLAGALIPVVFTGALSAIGLVLKQQDSDVKVAAVKDDVAAVKDDVAANTEQSKGNAQTLAVIAPQITEAVSQATDAATQASAAGATAQQAVHVSSSTQAAVNGRMDQYEQLSNRVGSLQAQLAAALARIDEAAKSKQAADAAFDRGVDLGRELPAAPPAEPPS
jgi:septal ring factor EnvC (AmiA/AmiB activator)